MRLLGIAQSYLSDEPTDIAGVFIHRQFRVLSQKGWDIRVVNPQALFYRELKGRGRFYPVHSLRDGIPIWRPRFFWLPRWINSHGFIYEWSYKSAVFRALNAVTRDWQPDLVVGDWIVPGGYAAVRTGRRFDVPLILRARGNDVEIMIRTSKQSPRHRAHYRGIVDEASWVVCQGDGLYQELLESKLYDEKKLKPITNGLDTALFHPASPAERAEARRRLDLPVQGQIVLFVGRWESAKGSRELTQALKAIMPRFPSTHFVSIGPIRDELSRSELQRSLTRVHFFGPVEPQKVNQFYHASDVFVLPSYREGLPNALLEALACGLLVIATPVGGIATVVRNGENGLLVEPKDPAAIADALTRGLQDVDKSLAMRIAAERTIVEKRYDLESVANDIHVLFSSCAARRATT